MTGLLRHLAGLAAVAVLSPASLGAVPRSERDALIALYTSTNGEAWTNNSHWLDAPGTECEWFGVTCDAQSGAVMRLELGGNNLDGTLPAELGDLNALVTLNLEDNQIRGEIPWNLGRLSALSYLSLSRNQLSNSIPPDLGRLPALQYLSLSVNRLSGSIPTELGGLSALTYLNLSVNQLSGSIPRELGELSALTSLYLPYNQLTGSIPTELGGLSALTHLDLSANRLTGSIPKGLGDLSALTTLDLHSNQLSGSIPSELGDLSALTYLFLPRNQLDGSIPGELGRLSALTVLHLGQNRLQEQIPDELGDLAALRVLVLGGNMLRGEIPTTLPRLPSLGWLDLHYNALYTSDSELRRFLDRAAPDWSSTQTVAPVAPYAALLTPDSVKLAWLPITFQDSGGSYEIQCGIPGGFWGDCGSTSSKEDREFRVTGLPSSAERHFRVRTRSDPHRWNQNVVLSEYTPRISATTTAPGIKWAVPLGSTTWSSPTLGPEGTIYVVNDWGFLFAVHPDGGVKWLFRGRTGSNPTVAVSADGRRLYLPTAGELIALPTHVPHPVWTFEGDSLASQAMALAGDGSVYVVRDRKVHALTPEGEESWQRDYSDLPELGAAQPFWLAVDHEGRLWVAALSERQPVGWLDRLNPDGTRAWAIPWSVDNSPVVDSDGRVHLLASEEPAGPKYLATPQSQLPPVELTRGRASPSLAIGREGSIYAGVSDRLFSVDPVGRTVHWERRTTEGTDVWAPVVGRDGAIYFNSTDGHLHVLDSSGNNLRQVPLEGYTLSSPAIGADGTVYVGTGFGPPGMFGYLYAIEGDSGGVAHSSWPAYLHDMRRSNRAGHPDPVVNQINDGLPSEQMSCTVGTLQQSFTTSASSLVGVRLRLGIGESFPASGLSTGIRISGPGSPARPLARASTFVHGPRTPGTSVEVQFEIWPALAVAPGQPYRIEWIPPTRGSDELSWGLAPGNPYARGTASDCSGRPMREGDFLFATLAPRAPARQSP